MDSSEILMRLIVLCRRDVAAVDHFLILFMKKLFIVQMLFSECISSIDQPMICEFVTDVSR